MRTREMLGLKILWVKFIVIDGPYHTNVYIPFYGENFLHQISMYH